MLQPVREPEFLGVAGRQPYDAFSVPLGGHLDPQAIGRVRGEVDAGSGGRERVVFPLTSKAGAVSTVPAEEVLRSPQL